VNIGSWSDMKQFDDDHDQDYFKEEERRLGNILRSKLQIMQILNTVLMNHVVFHSND